MAGNPLKDKGASVVACICAYELLALIPETPFPTFSHIITTKRHGWLLGAALIGGFACEWWVHWGGEELAGDVIDAVTPDPVR